MPQARDPRTDRRTVRLVDQHGRYYSAALDIRSGAPTGLIDPLWVYQKGYTVPNYLVPPQEYIKFLGDDHPGEVFIDYDAWIADRKEGWKKRRLLISEIEIRLRGDKADPKHPGAETLQAVGPAPQAIELLLAMKKGNKWALGLSEKRPTWAEPFIPLEAHQPDEEFPDAPEDEPTADGEQPPAKRKPAGRKGSKRRGRRPTRHIPEPEPAPAGGE